MSRFEDRLWSELLSEHGAELALADVQRAPASIHGWDRWKERVGRVLRRRRWRALAGVLAVAVLAGAGAAVFGPTGNPKELSAFECGRSDRSGYEGQLVDPNPVSACAALWPSLYHRAAPPLRAWVGATGGIVWVLPANVAPRERGWIRLPPGWRTDGALIELTDQLEDITTGLPSRSCWPAGSAAALVKSVLRGDGLTGWRVVPQTVPSTETHATCAAVETPPSIEVQTHTINIRLVRRRMPAGGSWPSPAGRTEGQRLSSVETRVNHALLASGSCATVTQAAALWRSEARAGGVRQVYNLVSLASKSNGGTPCSRIIVDVLGGGTINVLATYYP
ncbi:MAG TPA: hypothetical protein VK721_10740 [Solirubrobacteraceae bacterium]|jgi:hypothetical protein|nr:hypothetical protein [Solirubrobacteraceae bacterium]